MAGTGDVGTGTTIAFGTSSYAAKITNVSFGPRTRALVDTTDMSTTGARTKRVGDLVDNGTFEVAIIFDPDLPVPIEVVAETITVTWPIPSGLTAGATDAFTGAIISTNGTAPLEDLMVGSYTVAVMDDITQADAS